LTKEFNSVVFPAPLAPTANIVFAIYFSLKVSSNFGNRFISIPYFSESFFDLILPNIGSLGLFSLM